MLNFTPATNLATLVQDLTVLPGSSVNATEFRDTLRVFFMSHGHDGIFYATSSNGIDFNNHLQKVTAPGVGVLGNTTPSPISFLNKLFVFFTGNGRDGLFFVTSTDAEHWPHPPNKVTDTVPAQGANFSSPSTVVFQNKLFVFYNDATGSGISKVSTSDGTSFSPIQSLAAQNINMFVMPNTSPSAVVLDGKLFVFFNSNGGDGINFTTSTDGQTWTKVLSVSKGLNSCVPSQIGVSSGATAFNAGKDLALFWTQFNGLGPFGAQFDGTNWSQEQFMPTFVPHLVFTSGTTPSAAHADGKSFAFWVGPSGNVLSIFFSNFTAA